MILTGFVFISLITTSCAELVEKPPNRFTAVVGQTVRLNCKTNITGSLYWGYQSLSSNVRETLFTAGQFVQRFRQQYALGSDSHGGYDLVIPNVGFDIAGYYTCIDEDNYDPKVEQEGRSATTSLIIIDGLLNCTSNMTEVGVITGDICGLTVEPDNINLTCRMKAFGRNVTQVLQWNHSGFKSFDILHYHLESNYFQSSFIFSAKDIVNFTTISCQADHSLELTLFQEESLRWSAPSFVPLFLSPSTIAETVCPLDEICCGINTNLKIQYKWKDSFNRTISTAKCINVNRTNTADNISAQSYHCSAYGQIRNLSCLVPITKTVKISCVIEIGSNGLAWLLVFLTVLAIVLAIVVVCCILYKFAKWQPVLTFVNSGDAVNGVAQRLLNGEHEREHEHGQGHRTGNAESVQLQRPAAQPVEEKPIMVQLPVRELNEAEKVVVREVTDFEEKDRKQNEAIEPLRSNLFLSNSTVVRIVPGAGKATVYGMTVVGSELFIARFGASSVEVYDANNMITTPRLVKISDGRLHYPRLAACSHYNCLYVLDWSSSTEPVMYRVELLNSSVSRWGEGGGLLRCAALSLTKDHTVLLTSYNKVEECTTHGELIREIRLDPSIDWPRHCIQLSDGSFVVCHIGSTQHRVCIVDASGRIIKSYGESPGSGIGELHGPFQLSVDKYDHMFVADYDNNRVQLLSPTLILLGTVQIPRHQLNHPISLHFDNINHRLYVNRGSDVLVIDLSVA